jgi:hypothetical protein
VIDLLLYALKLAASLGNTYFIIWELLNIKALEDDNADYDWSVLTKYKKTMTLIARVKAGYTKSFPVRNMKQGDL